MEKKPNEILTMWIPLIALVGGLWAFIAYMNSDGVQGKISKANVKREQLEEGRRQSEIVAKEREDKKEARKKAEREKGKSAEEIAEMYERERLREYKYEERERLREVIDDEDSSKSEVIIATEELKKLINE